jgi:hypothetical protein
MRPRPDVRLKNLLRRAAGGVTAGLRMHPGFLIIGAQKSGTTSLFAALSQHPGCRMPRKKEIHYFDNNYHLGFGWYLSYFPFRRDDGAITGEASPYYLFHPEAAGRAAAQLPDARLIAMLRDPVDRAYSHYQMQRRRGIEGCATFAEALEQEQERLRGREELLRDPRVRSLAHQKRSYFSRGLYAGQLRRWLAVYPRSSLLVLRSEDFFEDPRGQLGRVCAFLGLDGGFEADLTPRFAAGYPEMDATVRGRLRGLYRREMESLRELVGEEIRWSD